jgi:hypothetical protein
LVIDDQNLLIKERILNFVAKAEALERLFLV